MIESFADKDTKTLTEGRKVGRFQAFEAIARRRLRQLEVANCLNDLRVPPGNRLEQLKGDRKGSYSIRINDQYRICFQWSGAHASEVEVTDYH